MISAIVAVLVFGLVVAVVVLYARDPGPEPTDIAVAYELAWDRLDFDTLWSLSGPELRDGLDRREFVAAKSRAYAGRADLRDLAERVDVDRVAVGVGHAVVRTRVALRGGTAVCNDVTLTRQTSGWMVTGYQLVAPPSPAV